MQSLSLQFLPCSQASLLNTMPLSAVATGDGCEKRQRAFVHFSPNLHNVGDCGRSGGTNPERDAAVATGKAGFAAGAEFGGTTGTDAGVGVGAAIVTCGVEATFTSSTGFGRPPLPLLAPLPPLP